MTAGNHNPNLNDVGVSCPDLIKVLVVFIPEVMSFGSGCNKASLKNLQIICGINLDRNKQRALLSVHLHLFRRCLCGWVDISGLPVFHTVFSQIFCNDEADWLFIIRYSYLISVSVCGCLIKLDTEQSPDSSVSSSTLLQVWRQLISLSWQTHCSNGQLAFFPGH